MTKGQEYRDRKFEQDIVIYFPKCGADTQLDHGSLK